MKTRTLVIGLICLAITPALHAWTGDTWGNITRETIKSLADEMIDSSWTPNNTFYNWRYTDAPRQTYYKGSWYKGIPYSQWNPQDNWAEFHQWVNSNPGGNAARGNDCSGFVSITWRLPRRYTTTEFDSLIGTYWDSLGAKGSAQSANLRLGDALNYPPVASDINSGHIILFQEYVSSGIRSMEQTPNNATRKVWAYSSLTNYRPIRRKQIIGDSATPTVSVLPATSVGASSARMWGRIQNDGGAAILERRLEWGVSGTWTHWTAGVSTSGSDFYFDLTGLYPNTHYQFRAWARNSVGWTTSTPAFFTTTSSSPQLNISPSGRSHTSSAVSGQTLGVTANVSWTTSRGSDSWITITGGGSGSGNGTVTYSVVANMTTSSRTGTITVTGGGLTRTFTVNQAGLSTLAPQITSHPANRAVTAPDSATFSVSATGSAPLSYQWQRSTNSGSTWSNVSGATSSSYNTSTTTTPMNGDRYRVVVSNSAGSVISNSALLSVSSFNITTLNNAQIITGLSGSKDSEKLYIITVPQGQSELVIKMFGGYGDADLYLRHGLPPTLSQFDQRSWVTGNEENVTITMPAAGEWYILVHGYETYSGLSLQASYTPISWGSVQRGGFGLLQQTGINRYQSPVFGELSFANGGADTTRAFSHSLQSDLFDNSSRIYSPLYGVLSPNPWGFPNWVVSEFFGLVHFGTTGEQYGGWVSSERFGWMRFVADAGGNPYLWVDHLRTWLSINPDGTFHSFDFGRMVPQAGSLTRYNTRIGMVTADLSNPRGWLRSDRFGYVWFARDGAAVWFWSESRKEWIGITSGGGLWSTKQNRFL